MTIGVPVLPGRDRIPLTARLFLSYFGDRNCSEKRMIAASLQSVIPSTVNTFCVGSLPFKEADEAVNFLRACPWILPFWPELPQRDSAEFMVPRSDRALVAEWAGYASHEASGLFALIKTLREERVVLPLLKGQLLGPLSHVFFSEELHGDFAAKFRTATAACLRQIEWQISVLDEVSASQLLVLDEPGFIYWDKLSPSDQVLVKEQLTYLYVCAGEQNCFLGVHSCAPLIPEFFSLPFDLFSFDALNAASIIDTNIKNDMRTGNTIPVIAPGVVPATTNENFDDILKNGVEVFATLREILPSEARMLFSANCGHGLAPEDWVKFLYKSPCIPFKETVTP